MTIKLISNERIAETSSKGNQEKWYDKSTDTWYKLDQFGYEALAETLNTVSSTQSQAAGYNLYSPDEFGTKPLRKTTGNAGF